MAVRWFSDFSSSSVARIGYDETSQETHVVFKPKLAHWAYGPADKGAFALFLAAESKGKFFGKHIRRNPDIQARKISDSAGREDGISRDVPGRG